MKVRATEMCFVDGSRRREGQVFDYNGPPARYLVPVDGVPAVEEKSDSGPITPKRRGHKQAIVEPVEAVASDAEIEF